MRRFLPALLPRLKDPEVDRVIRNAQERITELQGVVQTLLAVGQAPWERVASQEVVGAAVSSFGFSNLVGSRDKEYLLRGRIVFAAGAGVIGLEPNGLSTNLRRQRVSGAGAAASAGTVADMTVSRALAVAGVATFEGVFCARPGTLRTWLGVSGAHESGTPDQQVDVFTGYWSDTAAELRSLLLVAPVADGFLAGSEMQLYRRATA